MRTETIPRQESVLRTAAGRAVGVARDSSGRSSGGPDRVVLDTGAGGSGPDRLSLTPAEARRVAGLLLRQASAAEAATPRLTGWVEASAVHGDVYAITARDHLLTIDQPVDGGGTDSGPTPDELLVASLAGGVAHYAGRHLDLRGVPREGLRVTARYSLADSRPTRVRTVDLRLSVPGLPAERSASLLAVARFCAVHNTLAVRPEVTVGLDEEGARQPCTSKL